MASGLGKQSFPGTLESLGSPLEARGDFRVQGTAPILEGTLGQTGGLCTGETEHACPPSWLEAGAGGAGEPSLVCWEGRIQEASQL